MENNINLTPNAVKAIQSLQHPCGTYRFYRTHLDRLFNYILNNSDEIGMSDNEAMYTLRALNALRADIADIAGAPAQLNEPVNSFDGITLTEASNEIDEGMEAIKDLYNTLDSLKQTTSLLMSADEYAKRAGILAITARMSEVLARIAEAVNLINDMVQCSSIILQQDKKD